jgi:L-alanine-DL-glutamate epimerase-like enolase superfamily enzyme
VKNGKVVVPKGPGLGVEPDLDKINKYTVSKF